MKISSASKKVLASALSAAMVVAFAPTVALAAPTAVTPAKYVSVSYDANGSTTAAPAPAYKQVMQYDGKYYIDASQSFSGTADGYSFSKWFIDANGDGILGAGEAAAKTVDGTDNMIEVAADATSVTLKAAYANPTVSKPADTAFAAHDANYVDGSTTLDKDAASISFTVANDGIADHTYVLTVTNPSGTVVGTQTYGSKTGQANISDLKGAKTVYFTDSALSDDSMAAYKSNLVAGDYKISLTDNGKEVSSQKVTLATITVKVGNKTETGLGQVNGTADLTAINPLGGDYKAYVDADGYYVASTNKVTVKGDATYTAVEQESAITTAPAYNNGTLTFSVADGGTNATYDVSVKAPSGVVYTGHASGDYTILFDQTSKGDRTTAAEEAGDYVVTATVTKADGTVKTASAKLTLTELKVEAGEGAKVVTANKAAVKSYFTDDTTDAALASFVSSTQAAVNSAIVAKDSNATLTWKLNGSDITSSNKAKAGQANTLTATTAAVNYAAAPEYSVAKVAITGQNPQYVLSVTPAAGTAVAVADGTSAIAKASDGKYDVTGKTTIVITATGAAGTTPKVITLKSLGTTASAAWKAATQGGKSTLEKNIGNTTGKWLAAEGVKAAIESGKASIDTLEAKYYATEAEAEDAQVAAYKALYEAVDAEANAQVKAYENGAKVVAGSKVYSMTSDQYAAATKAVAAAEKTVATAVKNAGTDATALVTAYTDGFNSVVNTANTQLTGSNVTEEKYTAADVKAAQEVTASLKAAKTADEAKAAIEAYGKLTDAQKALVATADVTAAQKVVSDAETAQKLKDSQDLAAARDLNGKKVTAKAKVGKKAQGKSFTYALAASESGATASYAKVSGSKYIKVSANGKVTFSKVKVQKKAKTYKAKVSVTYGTQTVTKTVQLVVKKK